MSVFAKRDGFHDAVIGTRDFSRRDTFRGTVHTPLASADVKQVVILKLDDAWDGKMSGFHSVYSILKKKNIRAGFGVVSGKIQCPSTLDFLQQVNREGLVELWHHGHDHIKGLDWAEFQSRDYAFQYEQMMTAVQWAQTHGISFRSFGTPFNKSDAVTNQVISDIPEMKVFMLASTAAGLSDDILHLSTRVNMEVSAGVLSYNEFAKNFAANADASYMVLQGHPSGWDAAEREDFVRILDYLCSVKGLEFMTPYEYYLFVHQKRP